MEIQFDSLIVGAIHEKIDACFEITTEIKPLTFEFSV